MAFSKVTEQKREGFYKAERGCGERGGALCSRGCVCVHLCAQDPTNVQVFMTCLDVLVRDGAP